MIALIIYLDVLIFTNIIVDYILLFLTATILNKKYILHRIIISAILGGLSSLYIFADIKYFAVNFIFKTIISSVIVLVAFSYTSIKSCIREIIVFLLLSFSYYGLIEFLHSVSSDIFYTNNFVNYLNISPIALILLSALFYIIIKVILKYIDRKTSVNIVEIRIILFDKEFNTYALVDSGHTLTDPISDAQIVIVDNDFYNKLLDTEYELSNRKRVIPIKTVSDSALLEGIRCDLLVITYDKVVINYKKPIVLKSNQKFFNEYKAIISKSALQNNYVKG